MPYQSVFAPGLFNGTVAVVTGGGSGLGRCIAHELSALGAAVALVGRTAEKVEKVAEEIRDDGGTASTHTGDIRDDARVAEVIEDVLGQHGRIDALVNNAGGQFRAPLEDISPNGFDAVVRNNLHGGYQMMRQSYLQWMKEHGGSVVNIIADMEHGWPMYAHSGAARAGMQNLTETAAAEWGASGIRINAVAPGTIASSGLDTYEGKDAEFLNRDLRGEVPLQRMGTESEISAAVTFLLSPAAAYITGTTLRVDGGAPNGSRMWETPEPAANMAPFTGFHRSVAPHVID